MSFSETDDKLNEIFEVCALHLKRMQFARKKINLFIPLNTNNYYEMDDEIVGFLDQYIFRFSKLQDVMGARLFPTLLSFLAEPMNDRPFIDLLNRLERLGILDSTINWIEIRRIRNDISHEYPTSLVERIEGINILIKHFETLENIVERCKKMTNRN
jgi:hypothetical protein